MTEFCKKCKCEMRTSNAIIDVRMMSDGKLHSVDYRIPEDVTQEKLADIMAAMNLSFAIQERLIRREFPPLVDDTDGPIRANIDRTRKLKIVRPSNPYIGYITYDD